MDLLRQAPKRRRLDASRTNFIAEKDPVPHIQGSEFSVDQSNSSAHILSSARQQGHTVAAPALPVTCTTYLDTGDSWHLNVPALSPAPWINHTSQPVQVNSLSHVPTSNQTYSLASSQADLICQQFSGSPFTPHYGACPADDSAWPMSAQAKEEQNETVCFGMVSTSRIIIK